MESHEVKLVALLFRPLNQTSVYQSIKIMDIIIKILNVLQSNLLSRGSMFINREVVNEIFGSQLQMLHALRGLHMNTAIWQPDYFPLSSFISEISLMQHLLVCQFANFTSVIRLLHYLHMLGISDNLMTEVF